MARRKRVSAQQRKEEYEGSPAPQKIAEQKKRVDTAVGRIDGHDQDIAGIRASGWVVRARVATDAIGDNELAKHGNDVVGNDNSRSVGTFHQKDNSTTSRIIGTNQVLRPNIGPGAVGPNEVGANAIRESEITTAITGEPQAGGPPQENKGIRRVAGNGTAWSAAASNHTHSRSFKDLLRRQRRGLLSLRRKIRDTFRGRRERELEDRVADLEAMVLSLCHLAFDDEDVTAEERERLILEDPGFRDEQLRRRKHDFGGREMRFDRAGRHLRNPHPDVPAEDDADAPRHEPFPVEPRPLPGSPPG